MSTRSTAALRSNRSHSFSRSDRDAPLKAIL
jgi:hypothetical protein